MQTAASISMISHTLNGLHHTLLASAAFGISPRRLQKTGFYAAQTKRARPSSNCVDLQGTKPGL